MLFASNFSQMLLGKVFFSPSAKDEIVGQAVLSGFGRATEKKKEKKKINSKT